MQGQYDYIVSVGVMEHISDFDSLYRALAASLAPSGRALIHSMFQVDAPRGGTDPFLARYIFPGGAIPYLPKNLTTFRRYFRYVDRNDLPAGSYPKTLWCWYQRFCRREEAIRTLLTERSNCQNVDFAIRVFKHYLVSSYCGLSEWGLVCNILVSQDVPEEGR